MGMGVSENNEKKFAMKRVVILSIFTCAACILMAQKSLMLQQKADRNRLLKETVQQLLCDKFPAWFREEVYPVVWQTDFKGEKMKWEAGFAEHVPSYIDEQDTCYQVTLYYKQWREEGFYYPYTAKAVVIGKTNEVYNLTLGGKKKGFFGWTDLQGMPVAPTEEERLSLLPVSERDSILIEIAKNAIREKIPDWPLNDFSVAIEQGDFALLRLDWVPWDEVVPDYVSPEDIYYKVIFDDRKWKEKQMLSSHMIDVYILEKTREIYRMETEYDWARWHEYYRKSGE